MGEEVEEEVGTWEYAQPVWLRPPDLFNLSSPKKEWWPGVVSRAPDGNITDGSGKVYVNVRKDGGYFAWVDAKYIRAFREET